MSMHPQLFAAAFETLAHHFGVAVLAQERVFLLTEQFPHIDALQRAAAREMGLGVRRVRLRRKKWWLHAVTPIIGFACGSDKPLVLLPSTRFSFRLYDPESVREKDLTAQLAHDLSEKAFMYYRALPFSVRRATDFMQFGLDMIRWCRLPTLVANTVGGLLPLAFPIVALSSTGMRMNTVLALVLLSLAAAALEWSGWVFAIRIRGRMAVTLEAALWQRILRLPVNFVRSAGVSELGERTTVQRRLSDRLAYEGAEFIRPAVGLASSLMLMAWMHPLFCLAGSIIAALVVIGRIHRSRRVVSLAEYVHETERSNLRLLHGLVADLAQLRLMGAERRAGNFWEQAFASQCRTESRLRRYQQLGMVLEAGSLPLFWLLLLALRAAGVLQIDPTLVPAVTIALGFAVMWACSLSEHWINLLTSTDADKRLSDILEIAPETDSQSATEHVIRGDIVFESVGFQYPDATSPALTDVSLQIKPGNFVGLAGPSGSGKSTLVRLLLGFERTGCGRILVDGVPLSEVSLVELRGGIDAVLQDEVLADGTIRSNIVGMSDYRQEEAWDAAHTVQLAEEIAAMPMGMQTFASSNVLSTSQQQRLLIARAIVRRPKILVLDEAMGTLGEEMQTRLLGALRQWNTAEGGMTCLIVSHRPSLLAQMDQVFVFDRGILVETRSGGQRAPSPPPNAFLGHNATATPFRSEALEHLASPQAMDQTPQFVSAWPAWALLAFGLACSGIGFWLVCA